MIEKYDSISRYDLKISKESLLKHENPYQSGKNIANTSKISLNETQTTEKTNVSTNWPGYSDREKGSFHMFHFFS